MAHDISKHPYWSRDEFMAFILLYAACVDMECTDDERKVITNVIDDAHLKVVEAEYEKLTDFERISVIESYSDQYFSNPDQKAQILKSVEDLFKADGTYDIMEHNVYRMLQKLL